MPKGGIVLRSWQVRNAGHARRPHDRIGLQAALLKLRSCTRGALGWKHSFSPCLFSMPVSQGLWAIEKAAAFRGSTAWGRL